MKHDMLLDALGYMDDDLLEEHFLKKETLLAKKERSPVPRAVSKPRSIPWRKLLPTLAACFLLCVILLPAVLPFVLESDIFHVPTGSPPLSDMPDYGDGSGDHSNTGGMDAIPSPPTSPYNKATYSSYEGVAEVFGEVTLVEQLLSIGAVIDTYALYSTIATAPQPVYLAFTACIEDITILIEIRSPQYIFESSPGTDRITSTINGVQVSHQHTEDATLSTYFTGRYLDSDGYQYSIENDTKMTEAEYLALLARFVTE